MSDTTTPRKFLSRDQIDAAQDVAMEPVDVPEWGGSVMVKGLNARQLGQYQQSLIVGSGRQSRAEIKGARERLLVLTVCDEAGVLLFSADDMRMLARKSAKAVDRVYDVAAKLSGITEEQAARAVEDFSEARDGDSSDA